ncbi:MAG: hypothetical protein GX434_12805 [Peptococcaceae bacterium]|nr:hypothetical protein [Peptococcaceae bacterium]
MKKTIILSEYNTELIEGYCLKSEEEKDYLSRMAYEQTNNRREQRFYFDELTTGLRIQTLSWVGVIELKEIRIIIQPKFNNGFQDLIDVICFINEVPFCRWHDSLTELAKSDFMELFCRLFLQELEKLWQKGLYKEYISEEDNLRQLRGRPDLVHNLQYNHTKPTRIYCRYDELVTDIVDNQIIRLALEIVARFRLSPETERKLSRYRTEFALVCDSYLGEDWPQFFYHRLNAHYELAHKLSYYLVKQRSHKNIYCFQDQAFASFLFDMNDIFESFVATLLKRYLPSWYRVESQKRVTTAICQDGASYRHIIPDLIVTDKKSGHQLVLDTKYKNYNRKPVATEDIFQLAFYAQCFSQPEEGYHQSVLLYPRYWGEVPGNARIDLLPGNLHGGYLRLRDISVEETLDLIRGGNKDRLKETAFHLVCT